MAQICNSASVTRGNMIVHNLLYEYYADCKMQRKSVYVHGQNQASLCRMKIGYSVDPSTEEVNDSLLFSNICSLDGKIMKLK